ncbi:MAG: hypothetical protein NTX35_21475 [Verrucomicrobia bacterium]|nr:hypothetical protein [Verrucomicrobiota bacterium]
MSAVAAKPEAPEGSVRTTRDDHRVVLVRRILHSVVLMARVVVVKVFVHGLKVAHAAMSNVMGRR